MSNLFPYLFAILGIGLVVYAAYAFTRTRDLLASGIETTGTVTKLQYSADSDGGTYAHAFQFQLPSGETITVQSPVGSSPAGFRIGQSVSVRCDPADPANAKIHSFFQTREGSFLPAIVGISFLAFVFYDIFTDLTW